MRIKIKTSRPKRGSAMASEPRPSGSGYANFRKLALESCQTSWPVAYRWAAMGTLVAYSAVGSKTINVARAQDISRPSRSNDSAETQGSQPVRRFDIQAGPLDSVLTAFEQLTGVTVTVSKEGIRSLSSPGVTGPLHARAGPPKVTDRHRPDLSFYGSLHRLIGPQERGTRSVDVSTSRRGHRGIPQIFRLRAGHTPQTVSAVPEEVMQQQAVTTLRDALRNVAGISLAAGEGGAQGDNLTIRGFTARNDLFIDGMRDFGNYPSRSLRRAGRRSA